MPVDRFLGAAWAAVHGPRGGREMLLWTLEQGFLGLVPALPKKGVADKAVQLLSQFQRRKDGFQRAPTEHVMKNCHSQDDVESAVRNEILKTALFEPDIGRIHAALCLCYRQMGGIDIDPR